MTYVCFSHILKIIKPRTFDISIDSSSLNNFLSSFLHLLQIIERTNVFSKRYDILGFFKFYIPTGSNAIYFFHLFQNVENILLLLYHSFHNHQEKINLYILINFYHLSKINKPYTQKYLHIIESYACIL